MQREINIEKRDMGESREQKRVSREQKREEHDKERAERREEHGSHGNDGGAWYGRNLWGRRGHGHPSSYGIGEQKHHGLSRRGEWVQ